MRAITVLVIAAALEATGFGTASEASDALYFCDGAGISRADLDGSNPSLILSGTIEDRVARVDVDVVGAKLYYSVGNTLGSAVVSYDLVGGDFTTFSGAGTTYHLGVALHPSERKLYWTRGDEFTEEGLIERTAVDSVSVEEIARQTATRRLGGLAIDPIASRIYWTVYEFGGIGTGSIQCADLDGQNVTALVTGLDEPHDVALDLAAQKIYWTDVGPPPYFSGKIRRADLANGQNAEDVVISLSIPLGIDVDSEAAKVYWAEQGIGAVRRANLDGTNLEALLSGLETPNEVRLVRETPTTLAVPYAGEIEVRLLHARRTVTFVIRVPHVAQLVLDLYQVTGRRLTRLVDAQTPAGVYRFSWDGGAPNGVYFYRAGLSSGESKAGKIVLLGYR